MRPRKRQTTEPSSDGEPNELIARARRQVVQAQDHGPSVNGRLPKDLIPGYTILEEISRGGQGIVYKAVRVSTNHPVAIKVMRWSEVAQMEEKKRFEREIEILGRLSHPNIVGLHDGGVVADYRYLVMDFVAGESIDAYRRHQDLDIRETLTLFGKVCQAVQAAHVRGVVHRDLKPRNILVDANGQPHILDFGLAKLIYDECDAEHAATVMTQTGQFLGSLAWASPEQVAGDASKVDVRTDVYALGLILYHLFTRRFPYDVSGTTQNVFRNIANADSAKPSTHCAGIDGELDTIILKCLAKEPERRYQSAGLLASDLERYVNGEVIEARRESRLYVLTKTIRRHRAAAVATVVLLLATLGYAATLTVLYERAASAESDARRNAAEASKLLCSATETVGFLVGEVSKRLGATAGQTKVRKILLEGAYARLLDLAKYKTDNPALLHETGRAHAELGAIALTLGDVATAEGHFSDALELSEHMVRGHPSNPELRAELSIAVVKMGDMHKQHGHDHHAKEFYERALHIDESLVADYPENTHYLDNLLWSYERLSHLATRRRAFDEAVRFSDKQCQLAKRLLALERDKPLRLFGAFAAHALRFHLERDMAHTDEATRHARLAEQFGERLVARAPEHPYYRLRAAAFCIDAGAFDLTQGRFENAVKRVQRALAVGHSLVSTDPKVIAHQGLLWSGYQVLGQIQQSKPEPDLPSAFESFSRSTESIKSILELSPDDPQRWNQLAEAYECESAVASRMGRTEDARRLLQKALTTARSAISTPRESPTLLAQFARYLEALLPSDPAALQDALAAATSAVERTEGKHPAALYELALLQEAAGDPWLAFATFGKAAALADPQATGFTLRLRQHIARLQSHVAGPSRGDPQAVRAVRRPRAAPHARPGSVPGAVPDAVP